MNKITDFRAAEKYISRRLQLLAFGGVLVLIPASLAYGKGFLSPRALGLVMTVYVGSVVIMVFVILRNARAKFRGSSLASSQPPNDATRELFRKKIRRFKLAVAFFAFFLVYGLWETRDGPWPPRLAGAAVNLLFQTVFIQSIRRMQSHLKDDSHLSQ